MSRPTEGDRNMTMPGDGIQATRRAAPPRWAAIAAAAALVLAAILVFRPVTHFDFAGFDDDKQAVNNPFIKNLSPYNLAWIFTHFCVTSYYPIRLLSFAIDYHFWGNDAGGYHLTNVAVHVANVLLLFWLLLRLAGEGSGGASQSAWKVGAAAMAAAILAIHPVVVEPVVWVAGREELLMVFFTLTAVHLHVTARRGGRGQGRGRIVLFHVLAGVSTAMACMSNAVAVVIPALILAYDLAAAGIRRVRPIITGSWFLWAIAVAAAILKSMGTSWPDQAIVSGPTPSPVAGKWPTAVLDWFGQNVLSLIVPRDLMPLYGFPLLDTFFSAGPLLGLALGVVTLAALWYLRRERVALLGLVWFLIAMAPTSPVIPHAVYRADRLLYLPLAGLTLAIAACLAKVPARGWRAAAAAAPAGAILVILAVISVGQVRVWENGVTLFRYALKLIPDNPAAQNQLGAALARQGNVAEAVQHYEAALAAWPRMIHARYNLGTACLRQRKFAEAVSHFEEALRLDPNYTDAEENLGVALIELGRIREARPHLERALGLDPWLINAHANLGFALRAEGDLDGAVRHHQEALRIEPRNPQAHYNLGVDLAQQGKPAEAAARFREAIRLKPDYAEAYGACGACLLRQGLTEEALPLFQEAARLGPASAEAQFNLATALAQARRPAEAVAHFQEAVRLMPAYGDAYANLGVVLLTLGRADEAAQAFREVVRLRPDSAAAYGDLAFAQARRGDSPAAIQACEAAMRLEPDWPPPVNTLARILATWPADGVRNGPRAVELAERACNLTGRRSPEYLDTLAAAYAEAGQFDPAVAAAQEAADLAAQGGNMRLADQIRQRQALYKARQPLREGTEP